MAEYCLECANSIGGSIITENDVILTNKIHRCRGCGEGKYLVEAYRWMYAFERMMEQKEKIPRGKKH